MYRSRGLSFRNEKGGEEIQGGEAAVRVPGWEAVLFRTVERVGAGAVAEAADMAVGTSGEPDACYLIQLFGRRSSCRHSVLEDAPALASESAGGGVASGASQMAGVLA